MRQRCQGYPHAIPEKKQKITKICIHPQSLCYITFLIREWLLMVISLEAPFISWPSELHLKLLEARFAAFMLNSETHLGLFHNQNQPKICCLMLGTPMPQGSRRELQHRRALLSKRRRPGHTIRDQMRYRCPMKTSYRNASTQ